jgi:hypothetical protein
MIYEVTIHRVVEHITTFRIESDDPEKAGEKVLSGDYDEIVKDSEQGEMEYPEVVKVTRV